MVLWQVDAALATEPPVIALTADGAVTIPFDLAPLLGAGEVPTEVRTTLTDLTARVRVALPPPTLAGTVLSQAVAGLTAGHDYRLVWTWVMGPGHAPSRVTILRCVA